MDDPAHRVSLIQLESERLTHYLQTLPPDAWSQQSACARWRVDDVVTHLAGGGLRYAESIARGLTGDMTPSTGLPEAGLTDETIAVLRFAKSIAREVQRDMAPPPGRVAAGPFDAAADAERSAQIVIAARKRLGDRVLATFQATNEYLQQELGKCGPADWETPCYPAETHPSIRAGLEWR